MAGQPATIVLDNEAVVALFDPRHPKHLSVLPFLEAAATRRSRDSSLQVVVPVAVRIEAGWDRNDPAAAVVNRVTGARDAIVNGGSANSAARLRAATGVSVVDATVADVAQAAVKPVVILTSDVRDMEQLADLIEGEVRVVRV